MEKSKASEQKKLAKQSYVSTNHVVWDCGSSLYDSFELKAFEKQLDSAISSRTLSMSHVSDRRDLPPPPLNQKPTTSKISRSFHKLIRAVFRPKSRRITNRDENLSKEGFYGVSSALSTIPEIPEFHGVSPEKGSLVRRSASARFTAPTWISISCS